MVLSVTSTGFLSPNLNFPKIKMDILKCPIFKIPKKNLKNTFFRAIVTVSSQKSEVLKNVCREFMVRVKNGEKS